ncbi:hypothetical protein F4Z98_16440 [Candidatus Poribacteria bacterium]|nr:hypothetical protein [Candidatus Poribacteria bacterium]MDE0681607.1 hypothetical protein [Candidatus Poribacteria bacterium]MXV84947.1 hypothetical protein [Candidatus Poribacteria bacterium]MYC40233.1 hypothetical protein [Candidatus Dadabacteria bacterium]
MNEMEHQLVDKTLESIHALDVKIVELQGEIRAMREHNDDQHKALAEKLDRSIETDTKRLDAHSKELDSHREELAALKEWKKAFEESVRNRFALFQSISAIGSVIVAYLLSKFF